MGPKIRKPVPNRKYQPGPGGWDCPCCGIRLTRDWKKRLSRLERRKSKSKGFKEE